MPYPLWNYYPRNVRPPEWVKGPEMQQAGVENPKINWVYLNSDGSHIATVEK